MVPIASLSLVFDLLARDNASGRFRDVGNAAEKAGKKTSTFGTSIAGAMKLAAGAIAGVGLAEFIGKSVQSLQRIERINAQTAAVIKSTGGAAQVTSQHIIDMTGALENLTATEAESIQQGTNLLLTFTNIRNGVGENADIFDQSVEAMNDMARAMDTTGSANIDMSNTAIRLGKALNDPIKGMTALSRVGVAFTQEQRDMVATMVEAGDVAGAQAIILAELQKEFGGSAEAFARTTAGQVELAKHALGTFGETITGFVLPVLADLASGAAEAFNGIAEGFSTGEANSDGFAGAMETVGVVLADVFDLVGMVIGVLGDIGGYLIDNKELALALGSVLAVQLAGGITAVTIAFNRMILTPAVLGLSGLLGVVLGLPSALAAATAAVGGFLTAAAPLVAVGAVVYAIAKVVDFASAAGDARDEIEGMWDAVDDADAADKLTVLESSAADLEAKIKALRGEIGGLGTDLQTPLEIFDGGNVALLQLEEYEQALADVEKEILAASDVVPLLGDAIEHGNAQLQIAQEELDEWLGELQRVGEAFVNPLNIYKAQLDEKTQKEREAAEATAAATDSSTDSWEDYVGDVTLSLTEFATALEEQILAQENWRTNVVTISQRGGTEVAQILASMGEEGVQLAAQMADGTDAEFQRMADLLIRDAELAGEGAAFALDQEMRVMAAVGADGAAATVQGIAHQLGLGADIVRDIAAQYGLNLAEGINPILASLGKALVRPGNGPNFATLADGGLVDYFANGGMENHVAQIAPAGAWRVWAEPETGGEAYIPLSPSKRDRSLNIWRQVGDRLGVQFQEFEFGGINDVPRPPSTAPYRMPISTAGDATMEKAYGETVDWLKANLAPALGPGIGWEAMFAAVQKQFPSVVLHSGFRPGSITATGNLSYHALGRAIDITPDASIFNWIAEHYRAMTRELIFSPMGNAQLWNGANHYYGEPTRSDHFDHIHWALANGGILKFHNGGIVPNFGMPDVPALLAPGETVRTREQEAALQAPITVIAQFGTQTIEAMAVRVVTERDRAQKRTARSYQ